ncbi:MAG: bifunctional hydroxymethylpyrimidine kinase/phosphomethylpyrimidine kinase [Pyrinomonadaceae bacterium]
MSKICLSIAGLDPSGGAGVIADVKTFSAFGCFATSAITSVTFQNTTGVFGSVHQTADSVRQQVQPVIDDLGIDALKTGMLPTADIIEEVARLVRENNLLSFVVDPVVRSTSGFDLIDNTALRSLIKELFPLAIVITPNIPEAERVSGVAIESERDISDAASVMRDLGAKNILIKGGHLDSENPKTATHKAVDHLFVGGDLYKIEGDWHDTAATHGTGCVLSAAITANLAIGKPLLEAVRTAKAFVNGAIRTAPSLGHGHSPINIKPWQE